MVRDVTTDPPARARSVEELAAKVSRLVSEASISAGLAFRPRPSDVIITPYSKCGTTWLQQMAHSLRTGGDLDFDDISRVVPWIETAGDLGLDLDAEQRGDPRLFKSHCSADVVPAGGRYIVSVRDPGDALVSVYRFFEGWFFEPGSIDIETIGRIRFLQDRDYYRHMASWLRRRDDSDVLLLAYEHMKTDHEHAVRRIAGFMGLDADDALIATAVEESSLACMRRHETKYDDLLMRRHSETACDLPPGGGSGKVHEGAVGRGAELSPELRADLDRVWTETIGAEFGFPDYGTLLASIAP